MKEEIKEMLLKFERKKVLEGKRIERERSLELFREVLKPYFKKKELEYIFNKFKKKLRLYK